MEAIVANVIYLNNCWFTNVGEAFIDIGAKVMLNKIFDKFNFATVTSMSQWYIDNNKYVKPIGANLIKRVAPNIFKKKYADNAFDYIQLFEPDYFVVAGMFATSEFVNAKKTSSELLKLVHRTNCKLIFLGLGGVKYDQKEMDDFKYYLDEIKPALVVTRDYSTYKNYKDIVQCIDGIDCAYWLSDVYNPKGINHGKYEIRTFNYTEEPSDIPMTDELKIVRPWHMQYAFSLENIKPNIMVSDSPYDYLTLYANAEYVYTDLVHATIPSLIYGTPVKFYKYDERSRMFDGLHGLEKDENGFLSIKVESLSDRKNNIIEKIKEKLF